jgi:hypothetical protein
MDKLGFLPTSPGDIEEERHEDVVDNISRSVKLIYIEVVNTHNSELAISNITTVQDKQKN